MDKVKTIVTAHAGSEGTKANTLDSIREMAQYGVDFIEIDVRTRDGVVLMTHDAPEDGVQYDTLEEAFKIIAAVKGLQVNVDLKEEGQVRIVEELAERCGMAGRYLFTGSVSEEEISYVQQRGLIAWYNSQNYADDEWDDPMRKVRDHGFDTLNTHFDHVTEKMLLEMPQNLSIWTVKNEVLMRQYLKAGVKNITTRMPKLVLKLRQEIQG